MRKFIHLAIIVTIAVTLFECSPGGRTPELVSDEISLADNGAGKEKEDGIRETQELEFEVTKDISLGYIPFDRLIRANEDLRTARLNGTYSNRIDALTWTERGPNTDVIGPSNGNTRGTQAAADAVTSGRMRAIWVDLTSSTTVWAGGVDGGLWKSTDITSTSSGVWSVVDDFFGNLAIGSICQSPFDTDDMYFGTGEKTFNVDAVQGGGVWKSSDHGVSWSPLPSTTGFWNISKILCDASGNVYLAAIASVFAGGSSGGIYRSTDGGTSWTNITPTGLTSRVTEMKISSAGRMHIVCGYGASGTSGYRYADAPSTVASGTWTAPITTFPTDYNSELAVAGTTLYALPSNVSDLTPTIYKSTDGGDNWAPTATSPPGTGTEPTINAGQGWYDLAIGVDPTNPDIVIAGGLNFYRTINGGTSWTQITRWVGTALNYVHADHHTVTWNGSQVLVGTDGGIFYSSDNGATFTDRNDGLRLKQFYSCAIHPTTTNYFLAGAQDNGTHQLTSAGLGGSVEVRGGDGGFTHIDQDEPLYQFLAVIRSQYGRSTNGGATWAAVNYSSSIGQFINPTDYDDIGNKMYTSASSGQYVRWDNPQTGSTFTAISIGEFGGSTARSVTVSPYTANRVFFGTAAGRVVKVDNAHLASPSATDITQTGMSASTVSCVAVGTNDNNLLATFSNYGAIHVWVTTTGGGSSAWTNITGTGLPDIPVRWAMFYPEDNTKAILATEMGIYETDLINGASTVWVQNSGFPVVRTNMLQYRKSDGAVLAATHGRGLWTSSITLSPYIRFAAPYGTKGESTTTTTSCRNYTDYTLNMNIDAAPTGAATVTVSIAGGATATQGIDYDFTTNGNFAAPSSTLTFASGSTTPQPITVRVYNDAEIESAESFTFNYIVSGATNALAAPSSPSHIFTISDNDAAPVAGGSSTSTIGTGGFAGVTQPFRGNYEKARSQFIYLASELTAAGFGTGDITAIGLTLTSKTSTLPYQGLTISLKNTTTSSYATITFETGATTVYGPTDYSTTISPALNTFTITPFSWDGTSNLLVEICYDNTVGNFSGTGDVVSAHTTTDDKGVWNRTSSGTGCSLAAALNSFSGSFVRPDLTITASIPGNPIETVLSNNRSEYVANSGTYYFYVSPSGNIINSLTGTSANLGCTSSNIFEAGSTWQPFLGGFRSQKVVEITPTTNSGATYTVGIYFSAAELSTYSGTPASLRLVKTTAATMATANSSNTSKADPTTFTAFGTGYVFTGTFTGFSKFFLIDASVSLPVTLLSFNGRLEKKTIPLDWSTSQELNSSHFEIEKSTDGNNFRQIGKVTAAGASVSQRTYYYTDREVNEFNYYRLKMIDIDGKFAYSKTILIKNPDALQEVRVVNNPFRSYIDVRFAKMPRQKVQLELINISGARVYYKEYAIADQIRIDLSGLQISAAAYILHARIDGKMYANKVVKE